MINKLQQPIKLGMILIAMLLSTMAARAASFTAIASGNWSSTLTWGGTVPSLTNLTDSITIPAGITVNQDYSVAFVGAAAKIIVLGTLTSSTHTAFNVVTGIVSGTGVISVDTLQMGLGASSPFTGNMTANTLISSTASLQSAANTTVTQTATFLAGTFSVQTGGHLIMAANSTIVMAGGLLVNNGGVLGLTSNYNVIYNTGTAIGGAELTGSGLYNVNVHVGTGNMVTLTNNLTVNGTLTISSGTLVLASHDLNIMGSVGLSAGTITSTIPSNISISGASSLAGTLTFVGATSGVNNLTIAIGNTNQATISGMLTVNGTFMLTNGILNLSSATLNINGNIASTNTGTIAPSVNSNITVNRATSPSGKPMYTPYVMN